MNEDEGGRAQSPQEGFHATVDAKTPEELKAQLHDAFVAFGKSHEQDTKPRDK